MEPSIGALRTRFALERASLVPDGAGGSTPVWTAYGHAFGAVRTGRVADDVVGGRAAGTVTHQVVIRHRTDLAEGDRLVAGGRALKVVGLVPADPRGRYLAVATEEVPL